MPQLLRSGASVIVELHLPTDLPGVALRCRIDICSQDMSRLPARCQLRTAPRRCRSRTNCETAHQPRNSRLDLEHKMAN
jgi:hypothetical protein